MSKKIESAVNRLKSHDLFTNEYQKAYYKFSVPENYSELFEKEINKE